MPFSWWRPAGYRVHFSWQNNSPASAGIFPARRADGHIHANHCRALFLTRCCFRADTSGLSPQLLLSHALLLLVHGAMRGFCERAA